MATVSCIVVPDRGERVIFAADDGSRWLIRDRSFGPPHARLFRYRTWPAVGDWRASLRWFQGNDGSARLYTFVRNEPRIADVVALERQLRMGRYPGRGKRVAGDLSVIDDAYYRLLGEARARELGQPRAESRGCGTSRRSGRGAILREVADG